MLWAKLAVFAGAVFSTTLIAGAMLLGGSYGVANQLSPRTGFAVMTAYAVVLVSLSAWRLRRTDA